MIKCYYGGDILEKLIKDFLFYSEFTIRKKDSSIKSLKKDLEQLLEYSLENNITDIKKISSTDIRDFSIKLQKDNVTKRSLSRKLSSIRVFFKYLMENKIIDKNPMAPIKTPNFNIEIPEILSLDEINILRNSMDTSKCNGIRDRLILELLFSSGITPIELINLSERAIKIDEREAIISNGKEIRRIFFSETTRKYLKLYLEAKKIKYKDKYNEDIIFVNGSGDRLSDRSLRRLLVRYGKRAGIKKEVNPFIFRHTFGAYMLSHGMNIYHLKKLMGHLNIETTKIYQELIKKPIILKSLNIIDNNS
ncbi:tyrosine-type recombinase/integrase [Fusobacterium sp. FSA-380-WT-3A]|nr:tyrosine-type recombinase/integrase [Fusobacterium sp. FSA-380-WT-3A]